MVNIKSLFTAAILSIVISIISYKYITVQYSHKITSLEKNIENNESRIHELEKNLSELELKISLAQNEVIRRYSNFQNPTFTPEKNPLQEKQTDTLSPPAETENEEIKDIYFELLDHLLKKGNK